MLCHWYFKLQWFRQVRRNSCPVSHQQGALPVLLVIFGKTWKNVRCLPHVVGQSPTYLADGQAMQMLIIVEYIIPNYIIRCIREFVPQATHILLRNR
jgi:hypothetical protein